MKNVQGPALAAGIEARCWNGYAIQRRQSDGFVNATAMCKANGKRWNHYAENDRSQAYISALAGALGSAGFPANPIQQVTTGPNHLRGTWIHPRLAVDLARWISPAFAVWMDGWFLEALAAQRAPSPAPAAAAAPRRRRAPRQAPVPMASLAVEALDNHRLYRWAGDLQRLMCFREVGDRHANRTIRLMACHLLLSCERAEPSLTA